MVFPGSQGYQTMTSSLKWRLLHQVVVVQSISPVQIFVIPWTAARQAFLSFTISQSLLKFMSTESVMPSKHLILCHPLLLLPSIFPSIRVFSNESALCIRWRKYWNFSFNISPANGYSGLISFRTDWLDLLAVQETLKSLLQFQVVNIFHLLGVIALQKSSKILWCVFLEAEPGSWLKAVLLFLNCSSLVPASSPFPV